MFYEFLTFFYTWLRGKIWDNITYRFDWTTKGGLSLNKRDVWGLKTLLCDQLHKDWRSVDKVMCIHALSVAELKVVELLVLGNQSKQVAHKLSLSKRTVDWHIENIKKKFSVKTQFELGLKLGMLKAKQIFKIIV